MKKILVSIFGLLIYSFMLYANITGERCSVSLALNNASDDVKKILKKTYIQDNIFSDLKEPSKRTHRKLDIKLSPIQNGIASFYGERWNGRKTANGEIFDTGLLTAAHKTLPFGTLLKVTNESNGKSIVVRINDRGPYINGRIIDLTKAAFAKIEDLDKGVTRVKLEKVNAI